MGKKNRNKPKEWQTASERKYIRLYEDMTKSPAYKYLSNQASRLYIHLAQEYRGEYSDNQHGTDTVVCPYSDIIKYTRLSRASISHSLRELEAFGFIEIIRGGLFRVPNKYRFIGKWKTIRETDAKSISEEMKKKKHPENKRQVPPSEPN